LLQAKVSGMPQGMEAAALKYFGLIRQTSFAKDHYDKEDEVGQRTEPRPGSILIYALCFVHF